MKKIKKIKKFKKIIVTILLILIIISINKYTYSYQDTNEILNEQEKTFGINSFIENSKKYGGEFFEDIDINLIFNQALTGNVDNQKITKKGFNLFINEFKTSLKTITSILTIIIIHTILKSISENLKDDSIGKIIYYAEYIAIVTVIMTNFSSIINEVSKTTNNLVGFMNSLIPILISLMLYTGNIATTTILEPIILFTINFIGNLINQILIPITLIIGVLSIVSKIGDKVEIEKLTKFFNKTIIWILGIILTIFVGIISLEGTLSTSVDGITAKATKAIVSNTIPIVGKILGDAVDTVLGCGIILKNALGFLGVIMILGISIMPIIKLSVLTITYKILAGISEPIADKKIVNLLEQIGDIFKILLAILCSISVMIIIGTTLVIKMTNSGMMYR